jgi:hypothetical protein
MAASLVLVLFLASAAVKTTLVTSSAVPPAVATVVPLPGAVATAPHAAILASAVLADAVLTAVALAAAVLAAAAIPAFATLTIAVCVPLPSGPGMPASVLPRATRLLRITAVVLDVGAVVRSGVRWHGSECHHTREQGCH